MTPPAPSKRIPGDLPFVVRRSAGRVAAFLGGWFASVWVLLTVQLAVGLLAGEDPDSTGGDTVAVVALGGCGLVAFGAVLAITVQVMVASGPVLAADATGLWVRDSRAVWGRAVFVPWASVKGCTRRRALLTRVVEVTTTGGARYLVPLRLNDRSEAEILAAVRRS